MSPDNAHNAKGCGNKLSQQYSGDVPRQELVEFCKKQTEPKMIDSGNLSESIEAMEEMERKTGSPQTSVIHSLNEAIMENTGYQRAMRDVTEWAKGQVEANGSAASQRAAQATIPHPDPKNLFAQAENPIQAIHQAMGAASMCWEKPEGAGVFDSDRAVDVTYNLILRLREMGFDIQ